MTVKARTKTPGNKKKVDRMKRFIDRDTHPVMTMAGIMPGGSEMTNWYNHVPFPNPEQLAVKRAELLAQIEELRVAKERAALAAGLPEIKAA